MPLKKSLQLIKKKIAKTKKNKKSPEKLGLFFMHINTSLSIEYFIFKLHLVITPNIF
jgi:hypothetical protein